MALVRCPECGREISDLAKTCPQCGFPIVTPAAPKKTVYALSVGYKSESGLATVLRIFAVLTWIGGIIASIVIGNSIGRYFQFGVFLLYLLIFAFSGWMIWMTAGVVTAVFETRSMIEGMTLTTKTEDAESSSKASITSSKASITSPKASVITSFGQRVQTHSSTWRCKECGTENPQSSISCSNCGAYK